MKLSKHACAICGAHLPEKDHFVVRIQGFYTPEMKDISPDDLARASKEEIARLIKELQHAGLEEARELEEEVYKEYTFQMCRECYRRYIARPLPSPDELH
jgi:hypothetical protein